MLEIHEALRARSCAASFAIWFMAGSSVAGRFNCRVFNDRAKLAARE